MATPQQKLDYLDRTLRLNPVTHAAEIIRLRQLLHGERVASENVAVDRDKVAKARQNLVRQLDEIRGQFWTQSPAQLNQRLDKMRVAKFPDIKKSVQRMKLLLVYRDQINALSKEANANVNLLNTFKRVVMSSPRRAGKLKEQFLRGMSSYEGEHTRETKKKSRKAMVRMLKKKYPEIYQLEAAWFDEILRAKTHKPVVELDGGGFDFEIPGWLIGIGIFVILRFILAALRLSGVFQ